MAMSFILVVDSTCTKGPILLHKKQLLLGGAWTELLVYSTIICLSGAD